MAENMFTYEAEENTLIIHLPKEVDHHNCRNLKNEIELLLAENYVNKIVVDFTNTYFMDSSGIGVLINSHKQMDRSNGRLVIYGAGTQISRILKIGGILGLVQVFDTKEAAIAG